MRLTSDDGRNRPSAALPNRVIERRSDPKASFADWVKSSSHRATRSGSGAALVIWAPLGRASQDTPSRRFLQKREGGEARECYPWADDESVFRDRSQALGGGEPASLSAALQDQPH